MIYGIGTDILLIHRIEQMHQKYGDALPRRLLSRVEQHEFSGCHDPVRFLAKRFAAKEAFAKAVGMGIRAPVSFHNISVAHDSLGRPEFMCEPELQQWLIMHNISRVHLSLSDEKTQILAFAIAEKI
ncbi:holo-ACP synthase [Wielerella bovis]|uniref:holo-ACP synthase n=1 Tax=Wielerella bovis TaxID=2917790 RepID=UPI0020193F3B|nr:holo-ACP synthase [Wielerella bovis]ULJ61714.1 holo-ACP synthase [Wielerella bovis]ULJ63840.1 holo-ACP synthase [Wielerella bovis]ULJ65993.1 holo-ACP synthase [Wielerella bovis]ULJ68482.1 holo-ACP synthase [Wielerella bovis]